MVQDTVLVKIDPRKEVETLVALPQVRSIDGSIIQQEEIREGTVISSGVGVKSFKKNGKRGGFQANVTKPGDRVLVNLRTGLTVPINEEHHRVFHEGNMLAILTCE